LWDCATPQSARTYAQQLKVAIKLVDRQHKKPAMELFFMFQKVPEVVREIERLARLPEGEEEAIDLLIWMKTWILHDRAKGTFAQWMDFDDFVDMERTPEPVQRDLDALLMALLAMQWQRRKHVWNVTEHKRELEHAMRDYTHIGGRNDEYCERSYKNVWGVLSRIQRRYERMPAIRANTYIACGKRLPTELVEAVIKHAIHQEGLDDTSVTVRYSIPAPPAQGIISGQREQRVGELGMSLAANVMLLTRGQCQGLDKLPEQLRCPVVHYHHNGCCHDRSKASARKRCMGHHLQPHVHS